MSSSLEDISFVESQSVAAIREFRNHIYTEAYQHANPAEFLNNEWINEWINVDKLRQFLKLHSSHAVPKQELSSVPTSTLIPIKQESDEDQGKNPLHGPRTLIVKDGDCKVIEVLNLEDKLDQPISADNQRSPSITVLDFEEQETSPSPCLTAHDSWFHDVVWEPSDTVWPLAIKSEVHPYVSADCPLHVTREKVIHRLEQLSEIPPVWPVPEKPTGFILDLSDPMHHLYETEKDGKWHPTPDYLIKHYMSTLTHNPRE
ncbi:hypothetical protein E1B28_010718 [Marasmius oreades]|uniref:Uncharacterized protein n=1 Tax=Marasmius oreades TaxID=181124 RepID=A0A9P7RTC7_9AGAR|nr:hypothetical protein E1B28_010718 [Marasmius oreades]